MKLEHVQFVNVVDKDGSRPKQVCGREPDVSKRDERTLQFETFTLLSYYTETFPFHSYNAKPLLLLSYHFGTLEFLSFNDVTLLLTYNIAWVSFFITVSVVDTKAVVENIIKVRNSS